MTVEVEKLQYFQVSEVFKPLELETLYQKIVDSGELGRSKLYASLLIYLVKCSKRKKSPKEVEIAIDVLGRQADFDASKDSVVRVYIHQLRKKLDNYYQKYDQDVDYRIVIPKGQYRVAAVPYRVSQPAPSVDAASGSSSVFSSRNGRFLIATLVVSLLVNLGLLFNRQADENQLLTQQVARLKIWDSILDDDLPVLLVMGDYYIFGELNSSGNILRMVRDFNINSKTDLDELLMADPALGSQYRDLDLSYMPEGSAVALANIIPILQTGNKRVSVTMMSELNAADLKSSHIVYIGYISALDRLSSLVFAASGLQIGRTYDELVNRTTEEIYSSDAGLPSNGQPFRDYGLLSTFPAPGENQIVVVAGMRDAGLMHMSEVVSSKVTLQAVEQSVGTNPAAPSANYEALYEVFGFDRMNFDANLVYSRQLDPRLIWGGELIEIQNR